MSPQKKGAITRAINRFEDAVENYAFIGTIPCDSGDALAARAEIEGEYRAARLALVRCATKGF